MKAFYPKEAIEDIISGKTAYSFVMSRPESVQRDEAYYGVVEPYESIIRPQVVTLPLEAGNRAIYFEKGSFEGVLAHLSEKAFLPGFLKKHLADFEVLKVACSAASEKFNKIGDDKREIMDSFNLFYEVFRGFADYVWMPMAVEKEIAPKLLEALTQSFPDAHDMYVAISSPTKLNEFQKMRLEICDAVVSEAPVSKAAARLVDRYAWYGEYSYVEDLFDAKYFSSELTGLSKEKAIAEKTRIESEIEGSQKRFNAAMAKIGDQSIRDLADIVNTYVFMRTERVDQFKKLQARMRRVFDLVAVNLQKETGEEWTRKEVVRMMNGEISNYLEEGVVPEFKDISRRDAFLFYKSPNGEAIIEDEKVLAAVKSKIGGIEAKEVKGAIAFKGKVTGRARIVLSKKDLGRVEEGSILVARTTMPDYTQAMERAAAFVTEEGGITSHAAIIARELKKPCIVGTGNATKVLQDGDQVLVDAERGVVKIIEKNEKA